MPTSYCKVHVLALSSVCFNFVARCYSPTTQGELSVKAASGRHSSVHHGSLFVIKLKVMRFAVTLRLNHVQGRIRPEVCLIEPGVSPRV